MFTCRSLNLLFMYDPSFYLAEVMSSRGDGGTGVGGAAVLLSTLLHPCTVASSGSVSAATRSTKNRGKKGLQDQC
jgi:hypothetical protein